MPVRVYEISKENYKEAKKIIEADPYEKDSFSSVGYKIREGKVLGLEGDYYVYVKGDEEKLRKLDEKIGGVAKILGGEELEKAKNAFEEEEAQAESGFGEIFG